MNTMKMIGGLAALGLTTAALAGESPFSVELSMDVLSDYVWRGMICNGNPVWQPSVTALLPCISTSVP